MSSFTGPARLQAVVALGHDGDRRERAVGAAPARVARSHRARRGHARCGDDRDATTASRTVATKIAGVFRGSRERAYAVERLRDPRSMRRAEPMHDANARASAGRGDRNRMQSAYRRRRFGRRSPRSSADRRGAGAFIAVVGSGRGARRCHFGFALRDRASHRPAPLRSRPRRPGWRAASPQTKRGASPERRDRGPVLRSPWTVAVAGRGGWISGRLLRAARRSRRARAVR